MPRRKLPKSVVKRIMRYAGPPRRRRKRLNMRPHRFQRRAKKFHIDLTTNTQSEFFSAHTFALTDLINAAEIIQLFDQYKLTGIKLKFNLNVEVPSGQTGITGVPEPTYGPLLYYLIDHDDATVPANMDEIREYSATRMVRMSGQKSFSLWIKPSVLSKVYESVATSGYAPKWGVTISTDDPDVPHYGLKLAFQKPTIVNFGRVEVEPTYYFTVKNMK
uniref:Capsid protein n=1 Tax=uncultured marine virus TaxID=186617 RepID=S4TF53_9VIRU|nr:hypothetical protein [uncultured marine virus]